MDNNVICDQCGKKFSNVYILSSHKRLVHEKIKNFKCECQQYFSTKYKLQRHIQGVHSNQRNFQCDECGSAFKTKDMRNKHSRIHQKGPLNCPFCEKIFPFKTGLDHHVKQKHNNQKSVSKEKKAPGEGECDTTTLEKIVEEQENEDDIPMIEMIIFEEAVVQNHDKSIICDICGTLFTTKHHLKRHIARKHDDKNCYKFTCDVCASKFFLKYELQRHMVKHDEGKPFQCVQCDNKFKTRANLESHMLSVHNGKEKSFKCSLCSNAYYHKRHLNYHMRKHTDERRYECDKCYQSFLYSDALKWHKIRSHNIEAPFNCDICGKKFIHKKTLESHLKEHDDQGSLAVYCPVCSKKVSEKRHLKRHLRTHFSKSFSCQDCNESFKERYMLNKHVSFCKVKKNSND